MNSAGRKPEDPLDHTLLWAAYEEWSKSLRTWLVAYGVGAPVLLLTNDRIAALIIPSPLAPLIGLLFLGGVALQILLAAINKWSAWAYYSGVRYPDAHANSKWFPKAKKIVDSFWIDLVVDCLTLVLFVVGTALTMGALL